MTREESLAGNAIMPFGKHKGKSLWFILDEDPKYFDWMLSTHDGEWDISYQLSVYGLADSVQAKLEKALND